LRTFLAIVLILTTGIAALSLRGMGNPLHMAFSSSQIYIHGTPVCVTQRGAEIEAMVGNCGALSDGPQEGADGFHGGNLPPGHPRVGLPPGHPPVDSDPGPAFEERRRTLI